ncbi:uncharacterized protein LOC122512267 [Leptopilina heterotoma]|uniref:uncharacterized protein LOC122512267 n=1 Tax=Leptopilina heterotoma TaxID=63436 RepID=UPI001CAA3266|nr:uncharacterized protein LOC122512267 [Leptopilina heterotoma]
MWANVKLTNNIIKHFCCHSILFLKKYVKSESTFLKQVAKKIFKGDYSQKFNMYSQDYIDWKPLYNAVYQNDLKLLLRLFDDIFLEEKKEKHSLMLTAAARGHSEIVNFLCECDFSINEGDDSGNTPLHLAIINNHPSVFDVLVKKSNLNATNSDGLAPLHFAAGNNYIQFVEVLLKNGAKINVQTKHGSTLLHIAILKKNIELTEILLKNNADFNILQNQGITPLHLAIGVECIQLAEILLQNGADVNVQDEKNLSPLHYAICKEHIELTEFLLKNNADFNIQQNQGLTPLHLAIGVKSIQLAEILLQNGADVNVQAKNKQSPLYLAIEIKSIQLAEILLQNGADVNVVDKNKTTPLAFAAIFNNIELVELLLKNGATISEEQKANKETHEIMMMPLYYAVKNRNYKMVKLLMINGFNAVDIQGDFSETALHKIVIKNDYEILKYMVENGSKINENSKAWLKDECDFKVKTKFISFGSQTILQLALSEKNWKIWRYLLINSSKIDASPNSALHLAVREGQTEVVKKMVKQTDLDTNSIDSRLAVYIAVENGNEEILKILLEAGYSFKTCFRDRSPLHIAATFNHTRLVEMLLHAGADLNTITDENETCLHFAAAAGQPTVVKFLLEAGIDTAECEMALKYTLHRGGYFEKLWTLSPLMYKNISNIAEMLLIVQISKTIHHYHLWSRLSYYANKITVPEQSKQKSFLSLLQTKEFILNEIEFKETNKIRKYGNEFLMCFLNHLSVFQIKRFSEELMIDITRYNSGKFSSELMHIIFEYNDYRSCFYKNDIKPLFHSNLKDSNISLLIIGHIEAEYSLHRFDWKTYSTDLLKLFAARLFIISRNSYFKNDLQFYRKHNLVEWRDECEREVKLMEETEIDNDYRVTFYEILTKSVNKVANYTRNAGLIQIVESSYVRFPAYAEFLKLSVEKGQRRRELIDKCMNSMLNLIKKNNGIQFSTMEINQIFHYLSGVDMRRLLAALSKSNMSSEDYDDWERPCSYEEDEDYSGCPIDTPLYNAVYNGDLKAFLLLFDDISLKEREEKRSLLHTAAARGHSEIVNFLCECDFSINEGDDSGNTPLHLAIINNHPSVFDILVKKSNLNTRNGYGDAPLHLAAGYNYIQFVEILLKNGAKINIQGMNGYTPLHIAIYRKNIELTEILLKNNADFYIQPFRGFTLLHLAVHGNHIQLVERLLKNGANINLQLLNGISSLHIAVKNKYVQLTEILLQNGADVNVQDKNKQSPLHIAIQLECIQLAEFLLQNGADVNVVDINERTPLAFAAIHNNIDLVELLLKNGATISEEQKANKETHEIMMMPLRYAVMNRNYKMVKLLMINGFNAIDVRSNFGCPTALHLAVRNNDYEILKYMVENGSKINENSKAWLKDECDFKVKTKFISFGSQTILQLALSEGSLKIWRYLLKNSSKIDASPNSALHLAVREGLTEVVKKMVKQKDLDTNSIDSRLAVYIAVENGNEEILKILLEAGYSFKTCFRDRSPLHIAATFNHTRLVEMLLHAGADLNTITDENETCLHFAAAAGQPTVVKFLLEAGIDTAEFYMALEYTLRRGQKLEKLWTPSSLMYKNISNIAEMLIIVEISKTKDPYKLWSSLSYFANKITVSEQTKQKSSLSSLQTEEFILDEIKFKETDKIGKYGNEFLMCFLNHLSVFQINRFSEELMIDITRYDSGKFCSELMHIIFEYNDYRSCFYKNDIKPLFHSNLNDSNISLLIIGHIETEYSLHHVDWKRNPTDLLKLFAARLFIISRNSYFENDLQFYKKHNLVEWRDECEREVKLMEETEIDNDYRVTFYEILTQSVNKVAIYTRNAGLIQIVESSYVRFPAYAEFLKLSVEKGKRRRELIDKCMNSMLNLIEKNNGIQFTTMEINQIFQYLSVVDMRRLLAAFS